MKPKIRRAFLILTGIVVALVLLEIGLRLTGTFYKRRHFVKIVDRSDTINILCLGESTTAGLWLPPEDSYPKQLERMLNRNYHTERIQAIIPLHMGQNSSQIANRVEDYLQLYRIKLVIAMVGVNNEWSFAENNFVRLAKGNDTRIWELRFHAFCDRLRFIKVARFAYQKYVVEHEKPAGLSGTHVISGGAEFDDFPPQEGKSKIAAENQDAIIAGWTYDIRNIIRKSKQNGANMILMNYHFNPPFLTPARIETIAKEEGIPFLFNHQVWHREVLAKDRRKEFVMHDGWHPNRKGYAIIAANVFQLIQEMNLLGLE